MKSILKQANAALVIVGLVGAVLPAMALHAMTTVALIAATPALWMAYGSGWWALWSLLRIFVSFGRSTVPIGPGTILGLAVGSATVVILLWPVFTGTPPCSTCEPPELLLYRPNLLCVAVAAHWAFLHYTGFRLTGRSSGSPSAPAEL